MAKFAGDDLGIYLASGKSWKVYNEFMGMDPLKRYLIVQYSKSCSFSKEQMKLLNTCLLLVHIFSMWKELSSKQAFSGGNHWPHSRLFQTSHRMAGNMISFSNSGCHIGLSYLTQAQLAHSSSNVVARRHAMVTVNVLRLASGVQVCVVAREAVLTTTIKVQHQHTNKSGRLFLLVTFYARHLCFFVLFQLSRSVKLIFMCQ